MPILNYHYIAQQEIILLEAQLASASDRINLYCCRNQATFGQTAVIALVKAAVCHVCKTKHSFNEIVIIMFLLFA